MRLTYYFAFLILFILGCKKHNFTIELTDHTEQKVVCEGYFTDSLMKQQFSFTLSNNLGTPYTTKASGVNLVVKTPEGDQTFTEVKPGLYESDEAFKGVYGEDYTIQFTYEEITHEVTTQMPYEVEINEVYYQNFDSINGGYGQGEISMNISSPVEQYMRFSLYTGSVYLPEYDTVWSEVPLPVYRIAKINAGDSLITRLPIEQYDAFYLSTNSLVKVEVVIISPDVAEYLFRLKNYVKNELINNQSYNAPYYYSNEAYGLGHGAVVDSLIHQY